MKMNKQIVVTDWMKEKPRLGSFLKLTLSSDERKILRGKKITDCDQEIIFQLRNHLLLEEYLLQFLLLHAYFQDDKQF